LEKLAFVYTAGHVARLQAVSVHRFWWRYRSWYYELLFYIFNTANL